MGMNVEILQALIERLTEQELLVFTTWFEGFLSAKEPPAPTLPDGLTRNDKDELLQNWAEHIMDPTATPQSVSNLVERLKMRIEAGKPGDGQVQPE
jgi:hypothetical protein